MDFQTEMKERGKIEMSKPPDTIGFWHKSDITKRPPLMFDKHEFFEPQSPFGAEEKLDTKVQKYDENVELHGFQLPIQVQAGLLS